MVFDGSINNGFECIVIFEWYYRDKGCWKSLRNVGETQFLGLDVGVVVVIVE